MAKTNNLKDFLTDLYEGISSKNPNASRNPQNFRSDIESIESGSDPNFLANYISGNITELNIPSGITSVGPNAFYDIDTLTKVRFSNSVLSIGSNAFNSCQNLSDVVLPSYIETISSYAFSGCKISYIEIPASVTSIGNNPFYCYGIKLTVKMFGTTPPTITSSTFAYTNWISKIQIPESALSSYSSATYWSSLTSYFETY